MLLDSSSMTQRVSLVLWNQVDTERREQHISCVELFYRLHCLAPSSSICEDIVCQALLHKDKVKHIHIFCACHLFNSNTKTGNITALGEKSKECLVCPPQVVRLEALHRFKVLWHLTREIQNNRTMSLDRSFDRLVNTVLRGPLSFVF